MHQAPLNLQARSEPRDVVGEVPTGGPGPTRLQAAALLTLAAVLALHAPQVHADQPLWELGLGLGAVRLPHYRGSEQNHDLLLPVPYGVYRGKIFRATREGARAVLLDSERFDFDISVAATAPTRSSDNRARTGMPDLPATLELGPNFNLTAARGANWKLDLRLPVRGVVALQSRPREQGWTFGPVLNLDLEHAGWNLGLQGGPVFGSRRHHAALYGVDAVYATAARPAYQAPGGAGGWQLTTGASRRLGDWWLGGFVRLDRVGGAAFEASPLVQRRSHASFGLAFSRVFAVSAERVAVDD
jgi:MipA family protein